MFFVPVLKSFGWTRARLSAAFSIGWVTGGAGGPLIGWFADTVNPKKMMTAGAVITGLLRCALSRATSFGEFLVINGLFGICVGASIIVPCSLVIANWFEQRLTVRRNRPLQIWGVRLCERPLHSAVAVLNATLSQAVCRQDLTWLSFVIHLSIIDFWNR